VGLKDNFPKESQAKGGKVRATQSAKENPGCEANQTRETMGEKQGVLDTWFRHFGGAEGKVGKNKV